MNNTETTTMSAIPSTFTISYAGRDYSAKVLGSWRVKNTWRGMVLVAQVEFQTCGGKKTRRQEREVGLVATGFEFPDNDSPEAIARAAAWKAKNALTLEIVEALGARGDNVAGLKYTWAYSALRAWQKGRKTRQEVK